MLGLVVRNTVFLIDDAAPCFVFLASPSPGSASLLAVVITAAAVIGFLLADTGFSGSVSTRSPK